MKMPDSINNLMFAPCGINCMVCHRHCCSKKPCPGCLSSDNGKSVHCGKCNIKNCATEKSLTYCYECSDFPCKLIKNIEKRYTTRYNQSLISNCVSVKEKGIEEFMKDELKKWTCPQCGGIISLHDAECSECHNKLST